jgi:hypothetical protein
MAKNIVAAAQAGGKMGKTAPAGGGKIPCPKGDGLKAAWGDVNTRGKRIDVKMARQKVR